MNGIMIFLIGLIVGILLLTIFRNQLGAEEFEDELIVATEADDPIIEVEGELARFSKNRKYYVEDPADGTNVRVYKKHDMYEDADGKLWKLVDKE